jgi:hypothetical protein
MSATSSSLGMLLIVSSCQWPIFSAAMFTDRRRKLETEKVIRLSEDSRIAAANITADCHHNAVACGLLLELFQIRFEGNACSLRG